MLLSVGTGKKSPYFQLIKLSFPFHRGELRIFNAAIEGGS